MAFCVTCGKPAPCGVKHKGKGKPTNRSRNWANQNAASKGKGPRNEKVKTPNSPGSFARSETEWVMRGPNTEILNFPGTVTSSRGLSVKAKNEGQYFSICLGDHITEAGLECTAVYGIIFRVCLEHDGGTMGLVKDFKPTSPTPPNPLNKVRFSKGTAFGVQLLSPTVAGELSVAKRTFLVIRFDRKFAADDVIWTRDSYIQHYQKPKATIPPRVLYSDGGTTV